MSLIEDRYKLIEDCYEDVVSYLRAFGLEDELEDAVQDTFVEAISKARSLRDESKVKHWIIKIARSKGIRRIRKKGILATIECVFREDVVQLESANLYEDDALVSLIKEADQKLLVQALCSLKEKERKAVIHQCVYKEKIQDIAPAIGESLTNTKTILRRAKAKLKIYLINGGYYDGK